jgi:peptide/nickel transport system substrate-binding protein
VKIYKRKFHQPFSKLTGSGLLLTAIFLGSCGSNSDQPAPGPASGGTVVIGLLSEPATLNPLVASTTQEKDIIERLFLKLLEEQDDFLNFEPRLARDWVFSQDGLAVTFHLRKDVFWTDGTPCTARDVKFTFELQTDPRIAWPSRHLKDRIDSVEVVDDYTVRFRFSQRYPYQLMDANDGVIVPEHLLSDCPRDQFSTQPFSRRPAGNGPFMLGRWVSGQYVELVRNPRYYEPGKPYLDRVVFRVVPDDLTLLTLLKKGEIDCLESVSKEAAADLAADYPDIRIFKYPSRSMTYIAWNLERPWFQKREVRRALTMAIDRREIINTLLSGMAAECKSPMSPLIWAYDDSIESIPYDPRRAAAILKDNGWSDTDGDGILDRDGRPFEFEMITNNGNQLRVGIVTMAESYLRKVGIKVKPQLLDWNHFISRVTQSDFDSQVMGWKVGTRADLTELWHSRSNEPGGYNRVGYRNQEVDSLIDKAKNTLDTDQAKALWSRCQRIIYEDQPFTFIAVQYEVIALRSKFKGVRASPISFFINLRDWYIAPDGR